MFKWDEIWYIKTKKVLYDLFSNFRSTHLKPSAHICACFLHGQTKFSRCKIPRLRLDMEEWKNSKKKVSTLQEDEARVKESTVGDDDDQMMDMLETEARRMEKKRKGNKQERKSKRRKLEKLVGWG